MKAAVILPWFLLAIAAGAAERDVRRTFAVQPGCTLKVDTYQGAIVVEETDASEVRVEVHLEIGTDTEEEADRVRQALRLEFRAENNTVSIRARNPSETHLRFVWRDQEQIDLTYRIFVPHRCNLELATLGGSITVGILAGRMSARVEKGTIFFRGVEGSIDAATQFGDVIVSRCNGAVTLRTLRGTIRTGTLGGPARIKNTTGDIEVLAARAGIAASAEAGDVTVGFPRDASGDSELTVSGGNIFVRIDPAANCAIKASSVWGQVRNSLPLAIESGGNGKSRLSGRLNRGGPVLTLHANGGNVKLTPGETNFE